LFLWLRRFVLWRRWRRRSDLQVRAHLIEFPLADSFDRQQIFDAPESAALMPEIHNGLISFGPDTRNLLKLFNIRDVPVQRMRRRLFFLCSDRQRTVSKKIRRNRGILQGSRCTCASHSRNFHNWGGSGGSGLFKKALLPRAQYNANIPPP
jgi:hypothetical protein